MDYWFYHLESATLESCLPQLLEKTLERGWRAQVQFPSAAQAQQMDDYLWSYKADSFLPHGRDDQPRASDQPIIISHGNEIDADEVPDLVFLVGGVDPVISDTAKAKINRLITFVDSRSSQSTDMARARWSAAKAEGASVSYWRQDDQGRWAKQG